MANREATRKQMIEFNLERNQLTSLPETIGNLVELIIPR
jgi:hypothetical protein